MADPKGFLKIERELPSRRPVTDRTRDWLEFYTEFPREKLERQASRCMDCGVPFCHSGCPLGNLIPDWNDLTYRGRWREALQRLHATNNFPEFTGKLCPAPCESACVLGINQDPVAIRRVEENLATEGWDEGWIVPEPPARRTGRSVAVIGSGPAGLAAAQQLNRMGHSVVVMERADRIGGLLRYGIPDFKMEKWVLDRRLVQMEAEGVEFRSGVDAGVSPTGPELLEQFDALLLAIGSTVPRDLEVPGRNLIGIHFAMEYLTQQNRRCAGDQLAGQAPISAAGKRVLILGGGDTGADCLGTAHRQGAASVTQLEIMPEPPRTRDESMPWPTHPPILRSSAAHEEGGKRAWSLMTRSFSGRDGRVEALHAVRLQWSSPDGAGRRQMTELPDGEVTFEADLVLLAMGFLHPQRGGLVEQLGLELDARGNVMTGPDYAARAPNIFACGDARRGQSLIVWAIAEGRQAAEGLHACMMRPSGS